MNDKIRHLLKQISSLETELNTALEEHESASTTRSKASEILALTEQYFCPIKHSRKLLGAHERYAHFQGYGETEDFHAKLEELRTDLAKA